MPRQWRKSNRVNLCNLRLYNYPDAFVICLPSQERGWPWLVRFRHFGWNTSEGTLDRDNTVARFRLHGYRVNSFGKIVEINPPETTNA